MEFQRKLEEDAAKNDPDRNKNKKRGSRANPSPKKASTMSKSPIAQQLQPVRPSLAKKMTQLDQEVPPLALAAKLKSTKAAAITDRSHKELEDPVRRESGSFSNE